MRWRPALVAGLCVLPLVAVLWLGFGHDPHAVPSMLEHREAPQFTLRSLDGPTMALSDFAGQPVVVNFWATWCLPCRAEHALFQEAAQHFGRHVQFLGVLYEDDLVQVRRALLAAPLPYPQLEDPHAVTAIDYGVGGVPETFIIDAAGRIAHKSSGVMQRELLFGTLKNLLAAPPQPS